MQQIEDQNQQIESTKQKLEFDYDIHEFRKAKTKNKHQNVLMELAKDYM